MCLVYSWIVDITRERRGGLAKRITKYSMLNERLDDLMERHRQIRFPPPKTNG